jgi:hypothetical protein
MTVCPISVALPLKIDRDLRWLQFIPDQIANTTRGQVVGLAEGDGRVVSSRTLALDPATTPFTVTPLSMEKPVAFAGTTTSSENTTVTLLGLPNVRAETKVGGTTSVMITASRLGLFSPGTEITARYFTPLSVTFGEGMVSEGVVAPAHQQSLKCPPPLCH